MDGANRREGLLLATLLVPVLVVAAVLVIAVVNSRADRSAAEPVESLPSSRTPALNAAEADAAEAALAAYNRYREAFIKAAASADYQTSELAKYVAEPLLTQLLLDLRQLAEEGVVYTGRPTWIARVTSIDVATVTQGDVRHEVRIAAVVDCIDTTHWDVVRKNNGESVRVADDSLKYVVTSEAVLGLDGTWRVTQTSPERNQTC